MDRSVMLVVIAGLTAAACAADPAGPTTPAMPPSPALRAVSDTLTVYDARGEALYRATPAFVLEQSGERQGRLGAWNRARGLVQVGAVWVSCSEIGPVPGICTSTPRSHGMSRGIPTCPGDPRCPPRRP